MNIMNNNMENNLSRADKEKFNNIISKVRKNILEFKEYFFIGNNKKVFVVRSITDGADSVFLITILNEILKEEITKRKVRTCYNAFKS